MSHPRGRNRWRGASNEHMERGIGTLKAEEEFNLEGSNHMCLDKKMFGKDEQGSIFVGLEGDAASNGQETCKTFIAQPNSRRDLLLLLCLANDELLATQITKLASWQVASKTCTESWRKGRKSIFLKSRGHTFSPWIAFDKGPWAWCCFFRLFVLFLDQTDFYWLDLFFIPSCQKQKGKKLSQYVSHNVRAIVHHSTTNSIRKGLSSTLHNISIHINFTYKNHY